MPLFCLRVERQTSCQWWKRLLSAALCVTCSLKLCTCAFLADVGQVVVAGHVVPLAILVSDGHHTVLPACEEVIWLVLPPVLIHLQASEQQDSLGFICPCWHSHTLLFPLQRWTQLFFSSMVFLCVCVCDCTWDFTKTCTVLKITFFLNEQLWRRWKRIFPISFLWAVEHFNANGKKKEFQTEAARALVEKMMSPFDAHFRIQFHHFDLNLSPLAELFVHVGKPRFEHSTLVMSRIISWLLPFNR